MKITINNNCKRTVLNIGDTLTRTHKLLVENIACYYKNWHEKCLLLVDC